jgi:hypothetical protein
MQGTPTNPPCNNELVLEADESHRTGNNGKDVSILAHEREHMFSPLPSPHKEGKENIVSFWTETAKEMSFPLLPVERCKPLLEADGDIREAPSSRASFPYPGEYPVSHSENALREQLLAYGQAHGWPLLPVTPFSAISAGVTHLCVYCTAYARGHRSCFAYG